MYVKYTQDIMQYLFLSSTDQPTNQPHTHTPPYIHCFVAALLLFLFRISLLLPCLMTVIYWPYRIVSYRIVSYRIVSYNIEPIVRPPANRINSKYESFLSVKSARLRWRKVQKSDTSFQNK
jgi:hypothetical protein